MHTKLAILFGSAAVLIVATSASAIPPHADGLPARRRNAACSVLAGRVVPAPRIAIDSATDDDPDRARDAVVQEELETDGVGVASGDQSIPLAATTQSGSSELTVAPEPQLASTSRNTPATWTGGKYATSSQRSVAPEPTRWTGRDVRRIITGYTGGAADTGDHQPQPTVGIGRRHSENIRREQLSLALARAGGDLAPNEP